MMNALALGLVLTSLLTAGFFSPTPETRQQPAANDEVIVKDGHRVVVVEFEKDDGGHTKVLISPPEHESETTGKSEISESMKSDENEEAAPKFRPRELVCDAYGKCKHKIASAFEKTKEAVADKVHAVEDEAKQTMDKTSEKSHEIKEGAKKEALEIKEGAKKVKEKIKDEAKETKDKISEKSNEIKEAAKKESSEIKEGAKRVEEEAFRKAEGAHEMAKAAKREGEKELGEIVRGLREIGRDVFNYLFFSPGRWGPLFGILHLMGFASAYGTCVWVTFASSYVLAGSLPRGQFGVVQSRIYPVYFRALAYSLGLAILGHVLMMGRAGLLHGFNLAGAVGMVLANMLYLEPRAAKVMVQRMKKEKEEGAVNEGSQMATEPSSGTRATGSIAETAGRGSLATAENLGRKEKQQQKNEEEEIAAKAELARLSEKLRGLNSYSSFLNVLTLMSLTWHLVHLGHRLHAACY
ncbi:late embryogenesis abundant protein [Striga asiatica]|uniref:Late embryogenesis abundant protein n=1 Tax=Striga asiatica TaxID=4170 RepID=A0A5A7P3W2_STRAF|nr:late embryogenesis abundant protein [Striga asiatica]